MLDVGEAKKLIDQCWSDEIVPTPVEYIKNPNKSPAFDPYWAATPIWMRRWSCSSAGREQSSRLFRGQLSKSLGYRAAPRSSSSMFPARVKIRFYSTAISTSSRKWSDGPRVTALDPAARRRQALRPRRGRRRRCNVQSVERAAGSEGARGVACAVRCLDRGVRGIQLCYVDHLAIPRPRCRFESTLA